MYHQKKIHLFTYSTNFAIRNSTYLVTSTRSTNWLCEENNSSGVVLNEWMGENGCVNIHPNKPTSKRSNAIIDFAITQDDSGWTCDVIDEGTSDHFPVIFSSPFPLSEEGFFRKTNWKIFSFILSYLFTYWNALVYEIDEQAFFFAILFVSRLSMGSNKYISSNHSVQTTLATISCIASQGRQPEKKKYRQRRFLYHLDEYITARNKYLTEKALFEQSRREKQVKFIDRGSNIWKFARPSFHSFSPTFRGLTINGEIERNHQKISDRLGDFFEKRFASLTPDPLNEMHTHFIRAYENVARTPHIARTDYIRTRV